MDGMAGESDFRIEVVYNGTDTRRFVPRNDISENLDDPDCRESAGREGARTCIASSPD